MTMHVYPGMGANKEMYSKEWLQQPYLYHNLPDYRGEKTIEEMAQRLIHEHRIQENDSIIGTSLGGIIACEMSNQIKIKNLILIASAIHKDEVHSYLDIVHPLIDYTPLKFIQQLCGKINGELNQMFKSADPKFIRSMSKAIFQWRGLKSDSNLTRIHGKNDLIIQCPTSNYHVLNGGHLITMTHQAKCINIIHQLVKF